VGIVVPTPARYIRRTDTAAPSVLPGRPPDSPTPIIEALTWTSFVQKSTGRCVRGCRSASGRRLLAPCREGRIAGVACMSSRRRQPLRPRSHDTHSAGPRALEKVTVDRCRGSHRRSGPRLKITDAQRASVRLFGPGDARQRQADEPSQTRSRGGRRRDDRSVRRRRQCLLSGGNPGPADGWPSSARFRASLQTTPCRRDPAEECRCRFFTSPQWHRPPRVATRCRPRRPSNALG